MNYLLPWQLALNTGLAELCNTDTLHSLQSSSKTLQLVFVRAHVWVRRLYAWTDRSTALLNDILLHEPRPDLICRANRIDPSDTAVVSLINGQAVYCKISTADLLSGFEVTRGLCLLDEAGCRLSLTLILRTAPTGDLEVSLLRGHEAEESWRASETLRICVYGKVAENRQWTESSLRISPSAMSFTDSLSRSSSSSSSSPLLTTTDAAAAGPPSSPDTNSVEAEIALHTLRKGRLITWPTFTPAHIERYSSASGNLFVSISRRLAS